LVAAAGASAVTCRRAGERLSLRPSIGRI
jgi:hypothetical protein